MPKEDDRCCCCNHGHTKDCLFSDFVKKYCGGDLDKACQIFHEDSCDCYQKLLKAHREMLYDEQETPDKGAAEEKGLDEWQLYISHEFGCQNFEKFFDTLTKFKNNRTKQLEHEDEEGYLKQPL